MMMPSTTTSSSATASGRRRFLLRVLGNDRGIALVFVLLALAVLTVLALTQLVNTNMETKSVAATRVSKMALYAAQAGIQEAVMRLNWGNRTQTVNVNGADVRVWIPSDLISNPAAAPYSQRYLGEDGLDNGSGSAAPCGGSGLNDCSGLSNAVDDWGELYPGWRVNIWYASQTWVTSNLATLPTGEQHYATVFDTTQFVSSGLIDFGISANPATTSNSAARSTGGLFIKHKLNTQNKVIFTDGVRQFTAAQGIMDPNDGGLGLSRLSTLGSRPAWPVTEIWSTGRSESATRRLVAEAGNFPVTIPSTAVYSCGDPNNPPTIDASSNAFLVSGYDYQMFDSSGRLIIPPNGNQTDGMVVRDPNSADSPPVAAATVCCDKGPGNCVDPNDEMASVAKQITGGEFWGGNTGDGDTLQVGQMDVQALYDSYVPFITPTNKPTDMPCGNSGCDVIGTLSAMGDETNFVIARASGTGTLNVPNKMFGVLLVNVVGEIKIAGNPKMWGLFIVVGTGKLTFQGTFDVVGAMYVGADVKLGGNSKVFYSRDALSRIRQLSYVRLLRFWEQQIF